MQRADVVEVRAEFVERVEQVFGDGRGVQLNFSGATYFGNALRVKAVVESERQAVDVVMLKRVGVHVHDNFKAARDGSRQNVREVVVKSFGVGGFGHLRGREQQLKAHVGGGFNQRKVIGVIVIEPGVNRYSVCHTSFLIPLVPSP